MNLTDLLKKGYFPQELPPPFNTESFADNYAKAKVEWDKFDNAIKASYSETKYISISIPKVGFSRRFLGVPNPIHFGALSEVICSNWNAIKNIYDQSKLSASKPIPNGSKGRAVKTIMTFGQFKKQCLIDSFDKIYELRTDISKYYPSIYTHTIPWAIHTKATAKAKRQDLSMLGNQLDKFVHQAQSGQTIGVPIGPDTSLILSEILGCTFDKQLKTKFPFIKGYRYVDDYYLYFSSQADAERVFKFLQTILTDFTLIINEEKTTIKKFPFEFEAEWTIALNDFAISEKPKSKGNDIFNFVSLAFKYSNCYPKDSVLKWAIKKLAATPIEKENWELYESLIFKMALSEPAILPDLTKILVTYRNFVSKRKLASLIKELLTIHITKGHSFEVSWTLWIAKTFSVKIAKKMADSIFASNDFVSILIALDLKANKLISSNTSNLIKELELASFKDERWLFVYEAIFKKWLRPTKSDLLLKSKYFMTLKKLNVSFYDPNRQVDEINFPKTQKKIPKTYSKTESTNVKVTKLNLSDLLKKLKENKQKQNIADKKATSTATNIALAYMPGDE